MVRGVTDGRMSAVRPWVALGLTDLVLGWMQPNNVFGDQRFGEEGFVLLALNWVGERWLKLSNKRRVATFLS